MLLSNQKIIVRTPSNDRLRERRSEWVACPNPLSYESLACLVLRSISKTVASELHFEKKLGAQNHSNFLPSQ